MLGHVVIEMKTETVCSNVLVKTNGLIVSIIY
jgi:hypothetical protein